MPFLPCFLPPVGFLPRHGGAQPRPSVPAGVAAASLTVGAALLLFTPVGWSHSQPVVKMRVGMNALLPLRSEERALAAQMSCAVRHKPQRCRFLISRSSYGSIPPGIIIDGETGALAGKPTLPGTYTLAIDIDDGRAHVMTGPAFKIRVLSPEEPMSSGGRT